MNLLSNITFKYKQNSIEMDIIKKTARERFLKFVLVNFNGFYPELPGQQVVLCDSSIAQELVQSPC